MIRRKKRRKILMDSAIRREKLVGKMIKAPMVTLRLKRTRLKTKSWR